MDKLSELEMSQPTLERVIGMVHKHTGITMTDQKKSLLQGRLRRRMRALSLQTYEDYLNYVEKNIAEIQPFINIVTTNETSFFRTARIWEYFQLQFLPEWHKTNPGKVLKVWSAASSSGEEAYTIGICCHEFKLKNPGFDFKITGSDISTNVLEEAGGGVYEGRSIEIFRASNQLLFDKYLTKADDGFFKVNDLLKKYTEFRIHNLFDQPKDKKFFDIVFLRNVLIYFDSEDQEKVLKNISQSLQATGVLIIGESESLMRLDTPFIFQTACIYQTGKIND